MKISAKKKNKAHKIIIISKYTSLKPLNKEKKETISHQYIFRNQKTQK